MYGNWLHKILLFQTLAVIICFMMTSQTMTSEILFWTPYLVSFPRGGARISQPHFRQCTSRFMHPHVAMQPSSLLRHLQFSLLHPVAQLHVIRSVHDFGMLSFESQTGTHFSSTRCHPPVASGFGRLGVGLYVQNLPARPSSLHGTHGASEHLALEAATLHYECEKTACFVTCRHRLPEHCTTCRKTALRDWWRCHQCLGLLQCHSEDLHSLWIQPML